MECQAKVRPDVEVSAEDFEGWRRSSRQLEQWVADRVVVNALAGLKLQEAGGAMPPGHNGPYHDNETDVRNTAHWAISFVTAWRLTGNIRFRNAAHLALGHLIDAYRRAGSGKFFICRIQPGRDLTNGLIGQAWAIEGLVEAGMALGRADAIQCAFDCFSNHEYDWSARAWKKVAVTGRRSKYDWTFNHQLWFCAAGAWLFAAGCKKVQGPVTDFFSRLPRELPLTRDGLVRHGGTAYLHSQPVLKFARGLYFWLNYRSQREKSIGYHSFNTYALALTGQLIGKRGLWDEGRISKAFETLCEPAFTRAVRLNPYAFPYNPPGIEAAFSLRMARPSRQQSIAAWMRLEVQRNGMVGEGALIRSSADAATGRARMYEMCRLLPDVFPPSE